MRWPAVITGLSQYSSSFQYSIILLIYMTCAVVWVKLISAQCFLVLVSSIINNFKHLLFVMTMVLQYVEMIFSLWDAEWRHIYRIQAWKAQLTQWSWMKLGVELIHWCGEDILYFTILMLLYLPLLVKSFANI